VRDGSVRDGGSTGKGTTREPVSRREWIALGIALALALAIRLVYLSQIRDHPLFSSLLGDPAAYHDRAMAILDGSLVPDHAFFHSSPLYPFFLALVARVAGPGLHAVRVVQSLVGCVSVFLLWVLGRMTVGKRAALVAAFLGAVYVPFVFFDGETLEITLVIAFALGMLIQLLLATERTSVGRAAAAGALLGLAALGKPNLLLFAPVGAGWLLLATLPKSRHKPGRYRDPAATRRAVATVAFLVACAAVISPATIHNLRSEGDLIQVSSNAGINLFIGNNPNAPGIFNVPPEMRFDLRVASKAVAERAVGRELSAREVSDFWTGQARRFVRERPGAWLRLTARKFALFWNGYEVPNHYDIYFVGRFAPVLKIPVGTFAVVAPLGLVGIALALARRRRMGLLVAFAVTFMLSVLPFFITGRYRLAIVPVLLLGAGYAVVAIVEAASRRDWVWLARAGLAVAGLAVLVNVSVVEIGFSQMHNRVGAILGERGDIEGAVREFEAALTVNARDLSARYNLGVGLSELGRHAEAAEHFRLATREHPRYHEAWIGLGKALAHEGAIDEARRAWERVLALDPPRGPAAEVDSLLGAWPASEAGM